MEVAASAASISGIGAILILLLSGFVCICSLAIYVINGIAMMTIGKNRALTGGWMAFIPYLSWFQLGKVTDDIREKTTGKKSSFRIWLLICSLAVLGLLVLFLLVYFVLMFVITGGLRFGDLPTASMSMIFTVVMILLELLYLIPVLACLVLQYVCYYYIFADYAPDKKVLFLVLSILFSFLPPFFLFAIRNKPAQSLPMLDAQWQEVNP